MTIRRNKYKVRSCYIAYGLLSLGGITNLFTPPLSHHLLFSSNENSQSLKRSLFKNKIQESFRMWYN